MSNPVKHVSASLPHRWSMWSKRTLGGGDDGGSRCNARGSRDVSCHSRSVNVLKWGVKELAGASRLSVYVHRGVAASVASESGI